MQNRKWKALLCIIVLLTPTVMSGDNGRSAPVQSALGSNNTGVMITGAKGARRKSTSKSGAGEESTAYCPYWYLDYNTTAALEITNKSETPQTVSTTLLLRGIEHFAIPTITLQARATKRILLNQVLKGFSLGDRSVTPDQRWGDGSRSGSVWGAALIRSASIERIAAKIISESSTESLATHTAFYEGEYAGQILSSMWWHPTPNTVTLYALQNASYGDLPVMTFLYLDGQLITGKRLNLGPGSSLLVDLRDLLPDNLPKRRLPEVGMVRFVTVGAAASLLGRAVIFDERRGFSAPLAMRSFPAYSGNTLQIPGAPFGRAGRKYGFSEWAKFTTQLLLTNTSKNSLEVTITLDGNDSRGAPVSSNLPTFTLSPFESRVVDLNKARTQNRMPIADGYAGIRLTHSGAPVDLSMDAITVDQNLRMSFDNPIYDNERVAHAYYATSFNLAEDKTTLLLIKNPSNNTVGFTYRLNYEKQGTIYSYKAVPSELKPYELKVVDIKSIRDLRVVDADGQVLPADVRFGNAHIAANQPIIVGDPNFDPVTGISSSCTIECQIIFCQPEGWCDPCGGGGGPQNCTDTCTPCRGERLVRETACYLAAAACEAQASASYNDCLSGCDNRAVCQLNNPNYNQEACEQCKTDCRDSFLLRSAACAGVLVGCLLMIPSCAGKKNADCTPCID